jgi:phosphoglycolate phosphatase-like HAD superfamily hydrolase
VAASAVLTAGDSRNAADAAHAAGYTGVLVPYGYKHCEPIEHVDCCMRGSNLLMLQGR